MNNYLHHHGVLGQKWDDPHGGRDVTMDGTTQVTGLRVRTIYGSGPAKWLEVGYTYVTQ